MSDTLERLRERLENYDPPARHTGLDYEQQKLLLDIAEAAQPIAEHYQRVGTRVGAAKLQALAHALAALGSTGGAER